jgi:hypothetical protein
MFCHITSNWRGRPLESREVVVNLIAKAQTSKGLTIQADLNVNSYAKGIKVPKQEILRLNLKPADFHGEWNYMILPNLRSACKKFICGSLFFPGCRVSMTSEGRQLLAPGGQA